MKRIQVPLRFTSKRDLFDTVKIPSFAKNDSITNTVMTTSISRIFKTCISFESLNSIFLFEHLNLSLALNLEHLIRGLPMNRFDFRHSPYMYPVYSTLIGKNEHKTMGTANYEQMQ